MEHVVPVNFLAVGAATVASYILGAIWYAGIFSKTWMRLTGVTEMKPKPLNIILVLVAMFVMAYVLKHSLVFGLTYMGMEAHSIAGALMGAFYMWLGYVAVVTLMTKLYESKPWGLWLLDNAFWLISICVMSVILTVWP